MWEGHKDLLDPLIPCQNVGVSVLKTTAAVWPSGVFLCFQIVVAFDSFKTFSFDETQSLIMGVFYKVMKWLDLVKQQYLHFCTGLMAAHQK